MKNATAANEINWGALGRDLRESAMDAHNGELPALDIAYSFLLDNPECFIEGDDPDWPADMPKEPPVELVAGYFYPEARSNQPHPVPAKWTSGV